MSYLLILFPEISKLLGTYFVTSVKNNKNVDITFSAQGAFLE